MLPSDAAPARLTVNQTVALLHAALPSTPSAVRLLFLTACLALLLAVFLLAGGDPPVGQCGAQDPPADDHGDTIIDATELTTTSAVAGNVEIASDVDVFAFELIHDAATTVHVSVYTTGSTDTVGELYTSSDDLIVQVDDSPLADGYNFYILRNLDPGTYYVKVFGTDRVGATIAEHGNLLAKFGN